MTRCELCGHRRTEDRLTRVPFGPVLVLACRNQTGCAIRRQQQRPVNQPMEASFTRDR